ncbi:MAG: peptide-methionine (S)-S-oxide reductase MsrA [Nitrosarchaeum sp.]|nr:peptide-methionine (S)-S-oxide reductase MsrA [Nitrosarchaeum sp.]MCA9820357.1 peptide-methionine (S)-S-oxide reductase MsrA [Nitrosarchaeum sp.]
MKATFGAGCFWHVEDLFRKTNGVVSTKVGYAGGMLPNPTYEEVCTDKTGHAEAVQVEYDPNIITYDELLDIFWTNHDPTSLNRQGPDVGKQYRSVVFFHDASQKMAAEKSKDLLDKSGKYEKQIVTEIVPAPQFYNAEEYHQKYFQKHGLS